MLSSISEPDEVAEGVGDGVREGVDGGVVAATGRVVCEADGAGVELPRLLTTRAMTPSAAAVPPASPPISHIRRRRCAR